MKLLFCGVAFVERLIALRNIREKRESRDAFASSAP
jgi:hypothetical protein